MASPLIGIAAQNSLLFTAFQMSKRLVADTPNLTTSQTAAAGAIAGAVNSVMASPVELFKIRMQSQYGGTTDQKLRQVAAQLWNEHGFQRGVMRGFWITLARETPAYAAFYAAFTKTKEGFQRRLRDDETLPIWSLMASGSVGGISLWLVSYPLGEWICKAGYLAVLTHVLSL
jgi:solute carrier family 25 carnitine/acylcarnitine transporter 20/29